MNLHTILPVLVPAFTGIFCLLAWRSPAIQRRLSVLGSAAHVAAAFYLLTRVRSEGIAVLQMGGWQAPFGISFVADLFSSLMVCVAAGIGLAVILYCLAYAEHPRESYGYYPLMQFLLMGVCGAFLTGDLFNLYVWYEVMLMSSFVLLCLGGGREQIEGGLKYVTLNLVASALFLAAVGILYGVTGTLNMADLAVKVREMERPGMIVPVAMLFFTAFGIKAAVFPLFFWLPASYHTPPVAISALFAGLLTKVGVYSLIRVFTLLFLQDVPFTHTLILVVAGVTMVTGVLGAVAQNEMRRVLSFHIISQIGYMIMGLGLFTPLALAGSVFYIVHHILVKTNLFLVSGIVYRYGGTFELKKLGGLYRARPLLSLLFLIPALSLAGIPPLSGFFGKFTLVRAGIEEAHFLIAGAALLAGLLTLFSMTKIWGEAFWKGSPEGGRVSMELPAELRRGWLLYLPVILLAAGTVWIAVSPATLLDLSMDAAHQMLDPQIYIQAVLGGDR